MTHKDEKSYVSFTIKDCKTNIETLISTIEVGAENANFEGHTDAFIEDWSSTG